MSIIKYEVFLKVVEYGNFTRVAETMNFTQSGISHMIASLENELGVSLLNRNRGGVTLTADGREIYPYIKELCDAEKKVLNKAGELKGMDSGTVRLATFASVSVHWLPYIIKSFREKYPNIEFELISAAHNSEIESLVMDGKVDLSFIRLPASLALDSRLLYKDEWKVILPKGHRLCKKKIISADDIASEPFIMLDEGDDYEIAAIFDNLKVTPNIQYTVREDQTILAMVSNGLGISIMPSLMLENLSYPLEVRSLSKKFYREIGICVKDTRAVSLSTKRFAEHTNAWVEEHVSGK